MKPEIALTYDDISLVPEFSNIKSRKDVSLRTLVSRRYGIIIPIVASPMDTICDLEMAWKLYKLGGVGVIHRFMTISDQITMVRELYTRIYKTKDGERELEDWGFMYDDWHSEIKQPPIMAAIGVRTSDRKRAQHLVEAGANILVIDVAHGHHQKVIDMVRWCKLNLKDTVDIIAGNIATADAAEELEQAGVDGLRINVGNGCFTPDMKVLTKNGLKCIEDVKIGDMVYTHTGQLQKVVNKFEYDRDEEIMEINGIECTKNHEFYVVHSKFENIITNENVHEYAKWIEASELSNEYFLLEI
jgi:IMP dehydrogenase/GMP reductase